MAIIASLSVKSGSSFGAGQDGTMQEVALGSVLGRAMDPIIAVSLVIKDKYNSRPDTKPDNLRITSIDLK